jgi:BMFP domain-containing protein YqiC
MTPAASTEFGGNIRPRFEHALNGAMQTWSQLPKDVGEVEEISSRAIKNITRAVHDSAGGDTYDFQRQLIARTEQYTQELEQIIKELRNRLEDLNVDCTQAAGVVSDKFGNIMNLPE